MRSAVRRRRYNLHLPGRWEQSGRAARLCCHSSLRLRGFDLLPARALHLALPASAAGRRSRKSRHSAAGGGLDAVDSFRSIGRRPETEGDVVQGRRAQPDRLLQRPSQRGSGGPRRRDRRKNRGNGLHRQRWGRAGRNGGRGRRAGRDSGAVHSARSQGCAAADLRGSSHPGGWQLRPGL